jgi:hypothetical protein
MTVRELRIWPTQSDPGADDPDPAFEVVDVQLRVVFHGYEKPSFNLPVDAVMEGPNFDFQFIVNEPRGESQ